MAAIAFSAALSIVLRLEGNDALTNDPADLGGKTKWGITETTWRQAVHEHVVAPKRIEDIDRDDAEAVYFSLYWRRVGADKLPSPLNLAVFDAAVNQGVFMASRLLQRALRVEEDGVIGAETIQAAQRATAEVLLAFLSARLGQYHLTAQRMQDGQRFIDGWRRRVLRVHREAVLAEERPA